MAPLSFQFAEAEFVRAHRKHLRSSVINARGLGLATFALVIGTLPVSLFGGAELASRIFFALWLIVFAFGAWVYYALPIRHFRSFGHASAPQTLRLDDDGLTHAAGDRRVVLRWDEILKSRADDEFFFLYTDAKGMSLPIVIPRRALGSPDEEEAFRQLMLERLAGAHRPG